MSVFSSLFVPETSDVRVAPPPIGGGLNGAYLRALRAFRALQPGRRGLRSLPTELLAKILVLVPELFDDEPHNWRFSCVLLGFVCMDWMEIVEHNPIFFSNLYVDANASITLLQRTLERSGAVPFTLKIVLPPSNPNAPVYLQARHTLIQRNLVVAVFGIVGQEMHRCRRFIVDIPDERVLRRLFILSSTTSGDRVEEFSVTSHEYMSRFSQLVAQPFGGLTPRLKEMHVHDLAVTWVNYHFMSNLTTLAIHDFVDDRPNLDFIYAMLEATPLLETLRLYLVAAADFEDSNGDPPTLPLLSEIDIIADTESGSCLLTLLHMPALRVLRFKVADDQDNAFDGLLGHSWRIGSQITTLALQVSLPTAQLFRDCFDVFPNVESFDARGINFGFGVYLLAVAMHWPVGWKTLQDVFLDDFLEDELLLSLLVALSEGLSYAVRVVTPRELDTEGRPTIPTASTLTSGGELRHAAFCT
ncbi:hypothetical protein R3P38DRAFT_3183529 [Favolaschia claudopus]|uniref:F-box domain-containing protein n=1 Tax=Favolaschia claudopus TaxID=2862362 RepID=A0AAW0C9N9_9AGAR